MNYSMSFNKHRSIAYINSVNKWWGVDIIYDSFGLNSHYDVIILSFWLSQQGAFDSVKLYETIYANLGTDQFGCNNTEVQKNILDLFHQKQKKLFIAAFGGTDFPTSQSPIDVANKLADWVAKNPYIDGIDIDYEDNNAILNGTGVQWLISFQQQLRFRLGKSYLITHAPQAPYFSKKYYQDGGYYKLDKEIGNLIDWYNIQFYNQGNSNTYDTLEKLFVCSGPPFVGTSFKEITQINQIPIEKLFLGKPATHQDVYNTGYVNPYDLGQLVKSAEINLKLKIPGFFIWQLKSDKDGSFINSFYEGYNNQQKQNDSNINNQQINMDNQFRGYYQQNQQIQTNSKQDQYNLQTIQQNKDDQTLQNIQKQDQNAYQRSETNNLISQIAYITSMKFWWGPNVIDSFGGNSCYDILIMSVWVSTGQVHDVLQAYQNVFNYLGTNQFGTNNQQVQKYIKDIFLNNSKKLLIRVFGGSDLPTSKDPSQIASNLAQFLTSMPYIDGVSIDYDDEYQLGTGNGVAWLINFTKALRQNLINRNLIIIYEAEAQYFSSQCYPQGGFWRINAEIGNLIDFYDIQFQIQEANINLKDGEQIRLLYYNQIVNECRIPSKKMIIKFNIQNSGQFNPFQFGKYLSNQQQLIYGYSINQFQSDSNCSIMSQFSMGYNS